ncbi:hypothetical protein Tco_0421127 [Tanacetum coccineum]
MRDIVRLKIERELVRVKIHDGNAFWNEIGVNAGVSKLMLLSLNLLLPVLVNAARHKLTTAVFLDKQVEDISKHKEIYVTPSHTKKIFANIKREGKGFSGRITPLFQTMMVQAPEESRRKQRKDSGPTEPITDDATNKEHVSTPSYDPSQSGEDKMQLNELIDLCAKLSDRVLALENTNTSQAAEIFTWKERVKTLEKKKKSRTYKPRRLYKEDASKQGKKIADLDADTEVILIDETQGRNDEDLMFDTGVLNGDEVFQEPMVNTATTTSSIPVSAADPVTTAGEVVTTTSVEIPEELTLAQTLIEIKSAKPKAVRTAATTVTPASSKPKVKGIVFHDQEEQARASTPIVSPSQPSQVKDKGKAKMVEPEKPLKKKDQIAFNEEVARNLEAKTSSIGRRIEAFKTKGRRKELKSDNSKKQRIDEHVETIGDDDQEEAEMKKHMKIVQDDEVAIDAIPLATKPPVIVEWKIIKEGKM